MIELAIRICCRKHPRYRGLTEPTVGCNDCEAIHNARVRPKEFLRSLFGETVRVQLEAMRVDANGT